MKRSHLIGGLLSLLAQCISAEGLHALDSDKVTPPENATATTEQQDSAYSLPFLNSGEMPDLNIREFMADSLKTAGTYFNNNNIKALPKKIADYSQNKFETYISSEMASNLSDWLNEHGRARVSMSTHLASGIQWSGDYIRSVYETDERTVLVEAGTRLKNSRSLVDAGLIYREVVSDNRMYGAHLFIDKDMTRGHLRGSVGVEAVTPQRRLNANYYLPLSGWKDSDDTLTLGDEYDATKYTFQERAAAGVDLSLEEVFVSYPGLTGKVTYSRWFGDHVDMLGQESEFLAAPQALDVSMAWNPLQALKFSVGNTFKQGNSDLRVLSELTFDLSRTIDEQLKPGSVHRGVNQITRAQRHQFANRNPEMVLEYRAVKNPGPTRVAVMSVNGFRRQEVDTNEHVRVVARVINPINGQPVQGVPIAWDYYRSGASEDEGKNDQAGVTRIKSTVQTDAQGEAYIVLTSKIGGEVRVQAVL